MAPSVDHRLTSINTWPRQQRNTELISFSLLDFTIRGDPDAPREEFLVTAVTSGCRSNINHTVEQKQQASALSETSQVQRVLSIQPHAFRSLSYDMSTASSKATYPQSAI